MPPPENVWPPLRGKRRGVSRKTAKTKRKPSAAGRKAIAAELKKRWAAKKADAKKATR